jgi:hypothetical protein
MTYSIEKFPMGGCVVFGHYSFGVVPLISLPNSKEIDDFIELLKSAQVQVPDSFKNAFKE